MLHHVLLSVLVLSLTKGQEAASLSAEQSAEILLQPAVADVDQDATMAPTNATISGRANLNGIRYGAYVEKVVLNKCEHYKDHYLPNFYGGPVINTRAWKTSGNERWVSAALIRKDGSAISSTRGAVPNKKEQLIHTWEMLYHSDPYQDIRTQTPPVLRLNLWNFFPQIYIPLFLEDLYNGKAYMLHLYPEPSFLENASPYSFDDGILWARDGEWDKVFHVDIDAAGLIRDIDNFKVPNYKDHIRTHGQFLAAKGWTQVQGAYDFKRQIHVQGLLWGSATEYICQTGTPTMDITWTQMQTILKREMKWL